MQRIYHIIIVFCSTLGMSLLARASWFCCFAECEGGMYGAECNQRCGNCLNSQQCHHVNGTCLNGCSPGYQGSVCVESEFYIWNIWSMCIHIAGINGQYVPDIFFKMLFLLFDYKQIPFEC
jgi:hypothetical protein